MSAVTPQASAVLPRLLTGEERKRALDSMLMMVAKAELAAELCALAERDPSLLLEDSGLHAIRLGTILDAAVYFDQVDTVRVALAAGVHPDDPSAFAPGHIDSAFWAKRLIDWRLGKEVRLPGPQMLDLALQHGAKPDVVVAFSAGGRHSIVRTYAMSLNWTQNGGTAWRRSLECVRLLLEAGARCLDPEPASCGNSQSVGFLHLLGSAGVLKDRPPLDSDVVRAFKEVAKLAVDKGAELNYVHPDDDGIPQALLLAKAGWPTMALVLVELGAAESWELPAGVDPESFFSGEYVGLFRETVMRRRLQLEAAEEPQEADQVPERRRRRAAL